MVVRLRLAMHGRRHNHVFHLVAINGRKARNAKPIETLGIYDPAMKLGEEHKTVEWSVGRIKYWLGVGAVPSKTFIRLLEVVSTRRYNVFYARLMKLQGGVLPSDSKYHSKALGSRELLPTVNPESLKSRALWDSRLDEKLDAGPEEAKAGGLEGADLTVETTTSQAGQSTLSTSNPRL